MVLENKLSQLEMLLVDHLISVVLVDEGGLVQRASIPPSTYLARVRSTVETCTLRHCAIALSVSPSYAINSIWARVILLALLLPVLINECSFSTSSLLKFTVYFFAMMSP